MSTVGVINMLLIDTVRQEILRWTDQQERRLIEEGRTAAFFPQVAVSC